MITIIPILFNDDLETIKQMFLEWSLLWRDARCDVSWRFSDRHEWVWFLY